jgi:hypothetical protein
MRAPDAGSGPKVASPRMIRGLVFEATRDMMAEWYHDVSTDLNVETK